MPPVINNEKCIKCGNCANICPMRVFIFDKKKKTVPEPRYGDECWHCILCEMECPASAIKVRLPLPMMMPHINAASLHSSKGACDENR